MQYNEMRRDANDCEILRSTLIAKYHCNSMQFKDVRDVRAVDAAFLQAIGFRPVPRCSESLHTVTSRFLVEGT